jgi:hypothetical protein
LYYYNNQKFKKCEKRIDEILKELTSRELWKKFYLLLARCYF